MKRLILCAWVIAAVGFAQTTTPSPSTPASKKKSTLDIEMPSLGDVPKADGLKANESKDKPENALRGAVDVTYSVVRVLHAHGFGHSPNGVVPINAIETLVAAGQPPVTEPFSSAVRVKCSQKISAPIEVMILDSMGDTTMSAKGRLLYVGKSDESEWEVDWDPTRLKRLGDYQVLVRVAGQPLGTWPLKVAAKK